MFNATPIHNMALRCAAFCRIRRGGPGRATTAAFAAALVLLSGCAGADDESAGLGPPTTGSLSVSVDGLPSGVSGSLSVTSPQGFQRTITGSETLTALHPGSYTIAATSVLATDDRYVPAPLSQDVAVAAGSIAAIASVAYALSTGKLQVTLEGMPAGASAAVELSGPGDYHHLVAAAELLTGLAPGTYTLQAPSILVGANRYDAQPGVQQIEVTATTTPIPAAVSYALATGTLSIAVAGLPTGAGAVISVTGPQGFSASVSTSTVLSGLVPGGYTIQAAEIQNGGLMYLPSPAAQSLGVAASLVPEFRTVSYAVALGSLSVTIGGLPVGTAGNVSVSGPAGFSQSLTGTQALEGVPAGTYTISAGNVTVGGFLYAPVPASQSVSVAPGSARGAAVTYLAITGGLTVTIGGLPGGTNASVAVTGPGGYSQVLTSTRSLNALAPGVYTIAAAGVTSGGLPYVPVPPSQTRSVVGGATASAGVIYSVSTGSLEVSISGLPGGVGAGVTVTGPAGFTRSLTGTQTLSGLAPGTYTVTAAGVVSGGTTYAPTPASQAPVVTAGATASAAVAYSASGAGITLDLTVNGVYLTQAIQKYDGSVPLVAGRDAYLRVFGLANQVNSAQPPIRVRFYNGATLVQTYTIAAPSAGVPTAVTEGTLASSWNVLVPAAQVQPGLRVLAEVDPAGTIGETDEANNHFPISGTPGDVDVRALPAFQIRFVPVLQQVNGLSGNVSDANKEAFLTDLKARLPVGGYSADVRAPYTTTAAAVQSNNGNGAWGTILSEVLALRSTDASSSYYYGVLRTSYTSGVVGMGYVGGSARTAIGWDMLPSGSSVMAHEVGHNMGRQHAPCGGAGSPDPSYPYSGGQIGGWGLNLTSLLLKAPTTADVMGYCHPDWISDYNWSAMVAFRQGGPNNAPPAVGLSSGEGLLVWGRISDTGIVVEPGFRVALSPDAAPRGGPFRLDLLAADGSLVRTVSFDAAEVGDLPGVVERHFSFVLPLDQVIDAQVAGFRVRAGALTTTRMAAAAASGDPESDVVRANAAQVRVRWNAARYPMVIVRDAATGQVLSFARGGAATLWSGSRGFELEFSDGIQTRVRQAKSLK